MTVSKGQRTRHAIVDRAAELFNLRGYAGTSVADILAATGLEKGGLYNHFSSKDELALAAFDRAVETLRARHRAWRAGADGARATLDAFLTNFRSMASRPVLKGGCPLLNTAIEATDAHPALRKRAREAFSELLDDIATTVADGVARGEFEPATDCARVATLIVCSLEGAVMLSRLERDAIHMERVIDHLHGVVASLVTGGARA